MSIQRIVLYINGVDREILCEPEKDSLADVVRRLGLTGTKVGCGTGHCGERGDYGAGASGLSALAAADYSGWL